jgi:hypothetical protein
VQFPAGGGARVFGDRLWALPAFGNIDFALAATSRTPSSRSAARDFNSIVDRDDSADL